MKIVLKEQYDAARRRMLENHLQTPWKVLEWAPESGAAGLGALLVDADAIVSMGWSTELPSSPRLRLIQLPGAGVDQIDFDAIPEGCAVCNVYEHEIGIAEYVVLVLLEWEIGLRRLDTAMRDHLWSEGSVKSAPLHGELASKDVGFIGYGRIARESARRLRAFGVTVHACTRTPGNADEWIDFIAGMDGLDAMLARCDYIVITCPLNQETRGMIDAGRLAAMRPGAVLVNVARGPIVDEAALYEACRERRIGGAVIDTWYRYPPPESARDEPCPPSALPFAELDNVIMTPHASGWSAGLFERRWSVIAANLDRLQRGEPLVNQVHPAPG